MTISVTGVKKAIEKRKKRKKKAIKSFTEKL